MPDLSELIKAIDRQTYVLSVVAKELCLLVQDNVGARAVAGHLVDEMEKTLNKETNHGSSGRRCVANRDRQSLNGAFDTQEDAEMAWNSRAESPL